MGIHIGSNALHRGNRIILTMTIAQMLSDTLGYELKQFTIEGMTENEWRDMDDDSLMQTKSFDDYYNHVKKREEEDIERMKTRVEENDKKWARSIADYTLKLKGFEAMTEEEMVERHTATALENLKKRFAVEVANKWDSSLLNKSEWLVATSEVGLDGMPAEEPPEGSGLTGLQMAGLRLSSYEFRGTRAIQTLVRDNGWDRLTAEYSGGHDSGGIDRVYYTKDKETTTLNLEDFRIYGAKRDYRTEELKIGKFDDDLNYDTMFGFHDYGFSYDNPLYGPIRQRFGSWAGSESTYGHLIFNQDGRIELTGDNW